MCFSSLCHVLGQKKNLFHIQTQNQELRYREVQIELVSGDRGQKVVTDQEEVYSNYPTVSLSQGHVDYRATGPKHVLSTLPHPHTHTHRCRAMQSSLGAIMRATMRIMVIMSVNGLIIRDCANDNNDAPGIATSENRAGDGCH